MRRSAPEYDAIVVGSGMTGGWAAKELTELGLRTLVLDAGRPITPNKDYREHTPPWEMPFRGLGDRQTVARRQAVQRHSVTFDEMSHQFWVDDIENPYSTPANRPFTGSGPGRSAESRSSGDVRSIAGATWISRRTCTTTSGSTGRSATLTSRRGTISSSDSSA